MRETELWLFWTERDAREAGFRDGAHPADPAMRYWTPGRGMDGIMGVRPRRVVSVLGGAPPDRKAGDVAAEACARLQSVMPEVWVEVGR